MKLTRTIFLFAALLALSACGYGFGGGEHAGLPEGHTKLFISEVTNPTTESWLEPRIRSLLRDEITRRGWATWTSRSDATALIKVKVGRYRRATDLSGQHDKTLRSKASIEISAQAVSPVDGSVLWNSGVLYQEWPFFAGQENEADREVTELAIRRLVDRLEFNF